MEHPRSPVITLTTDFGTADAYVGVMKGVILGIAPNARLVDLTHEIPPQDIAAAAIALEMAAPFFPPGTIHLVVVDPGVGTQRGAIIVRTSTSLFVAPDNGVISLATREEEPLEAIRIGEAAAPYLRQPVSSTFHGRDLFAPVAAHLATGLSPTEFGTAMRPEGLIALPVPAPTLSASPQICELRAEVVAIDRFGNLITSLKRRDLRTILGEGGIYSQLPDDVDVGIGEWRWQAIVRTFGSVPVGAPLAYWGSGGRLEIAIREGSAAISTGAARGDSVILRWRGTVGATGCS